MKKPADMKRYSVETAVDAVIIGTGAGGAPLLFKLAQAGPQRSRIRGGRVV